MLHSLTVISVGLAYVGILFAVATWGDRLAMKRPQGSGRPLIYALSLGIYCTSWTYFGSVGLASKSGFEFAPIYIGPILVFALGWPVIQAIAEIAKRQNITSIADFISARYGKSETLGALVAIIAVIGIVPYISIQLKAVSFALEAMIITPGWAVTSFSPVPAADFLAFLVTIAMAVFAVLFGTRHIDNTEHQNGLMLAIAVESVVKLLAFLAVGCFVTFVMMGGIGALMSRAAQHPVADDLFVHGLDGGKWLTLTLLAAFAIILLPRQFHVTVVENAHPRDIKRAAWLFPLYLVAINLFVVPIAIAGLLVFKPGFIDADTFVLALPVSADHIPIALIAFLGGLSASTAMVIVEAIALSIMVCNNVVVPILLRRREERIHMHEDMGRLLIAIRRWSIAVILLLAYIYFRMIGSTAALAQTGMISFAAVAQFAPAFFGGLIWKRGTARGAIGGILVGFALWFYTLLLPSFADAGWIDRSFLEQGLFGLSFLRPRMLFNLGFDPLTHGVLWSLLANVSVFVALSLSRQPTPIEALQANAFVPHDIPAGSAPGFRLWRTAVTLGQLQETVARYLGPERAQRAFAEFLAQRGLKEANEVEADVRALRFAENLLASAVGAASSRLVMALLLERNSKSSRGAMKLLDDASAAIQYNRDLLQSAIDNVRQGIAVFDKEHTLICWNRQFRPLMNLPAEIGRVGAPLSEVLSAILRNADVPTKSIAASVKTRIRKISVTHEPFEERLGGEKVIEVSSNAMPDGGTVVTFSDITESVTAAEALRRSNETLERRVQERTAELTQLNAALERARAEAEAANLGKTRFLAAASHDILQPLNAARLFTSSLVERHAQTDDGRLVENVDASLEAVEDILAALLDISRMDAGALKPEISSFRIGELLKALSVEFAPMARERGLGLRILPCHLTVRSDRKMLRRVLQNLISNALKYTSRGRVLVGCRRSGDRLRIEVHDTGPGIPESKRKLVFQEFERLGKEGGPEPGLGLGLSIVERIAKMLKAPLQLSSRTGSGTAFSISIPIATDAAIAAEPPPARPHAARAAANLNILVVDNEASILEGMRILLDGWGCRTLVARNAAEAMRAWDEAREPVDLILADYHLHRSDGLRVIESLRSRAQRRLPAILITADRSRKVQDEAAQLGVHYLKKPVKPAALRAAMNHAAAHAMAAE